MLSVKRISTPTIPHFNLQDNSAQLCHEKDQED